MKYTIEQARILGGFNQVEIAERLHMAEKTYIQYEKYRRVFRIDTALDFVKATNIPLDNIIFFDNHVRKKCTSEV